MIDRALLLLRDELQSYMNFHDASVNVVIDNIGLFETSKGDTLTNNIIITLVNIEEESTLKNKPALVRPFNTVGIYQNPPVFLNLYVLLTCNYSGPDYPLALRRMFRPARTSASSGNGWPSQITDNPVSCTAFVRSGSDIPKDRVDDRLRKQIDHQVYHSSNKIAVASESDHPQCASRVHNGRQ